jgi:tetratricopeptide (TPR) repeat protein
MPPGAKERRSRAPRERVELDRGALARLADALPPQAPEVEAALLGALLHDPRLTGDVLQVVRSAEEFVRPAHRTIYSHMCELYEKSAAFDIVQLQQLLRDRGVFDAAEISARRAVALAPGASSVRLNLGLILSGQGNFVEAASHLALAPAGDPMGRFALGTALRKLGRLDEAAAAFAAATAINPNFAAAQLALGSCVRALGRAADAVERLRLAVVLAPLSSDALGISQAAPLPGQSRSALELVAAGNVMVEGESFTARSARLSWSESKDLLVFEGDGRADAQLYRQLQVGAPTSSASAGKILFWRALNRVEVDDARYLDFDQLAPGGGLDRLPGLPAAASARQAAPPR